MQEVKDIFTLFANFIFSNNTSIHPANKNYKIKLTRKQKNLIKELENKLIEVSNKLEICPYILASKSDIRTFVQNHDANVKFLEGWRYDAFGKFADQIL
ncbi:MAG: hypothetical protein VW974_06355 [Hyphomicrobiales bacterium]